MNIQIKYTYEEYNATHSITVEELKKMLVIKPNTLGKYAPFVLDTKEGTKPIGIINNIEFDDVNELIIVNAFIFVKYFSIEIETTDYFKKFGDNDLDVVGVVLTMIGNENGNGYIK